ncbi:hypothetical protein D3C81_1375320 [compost metagenome]
MQQAFKQGDPLCLQREAARPNGLLHRFVQTAQVAHKPRVFQQHTGQLKLPRLTADLLGYVRDQCLRQAERLERIGAAAFRRTIVNFTRRHQGNASRPQKKRLAFRTMTLDAFGDKANVEVEVVMAIEADIGKACGAQHQAWYFGHVMVLGMLSHGTRSTIGEEGRGAQSLGAHAVQIHGVPVTEVVTEAPAVATGH